MVSNESKNPFADPEIASHYEQWYYSKGRKAAIEEKALLKSLIEGYQDAETVLEVGCGTGYFLNWFQTLGLKALGCDYSRWMIEEAYHQHNLACIQGDGLALPFGNQSFDLVALVTTLEFTEKPEQVLEEALRVARKGIILGVINKHSLLGLKYLRKGGPIWGNAQLFTLGELKDILEKILPKNSSIRSRTTLWPVFSGASVLPWGGFIGIAVKFGSKRRS